MKKLILLIGLSFPVFIGYTQTQVNYRPGMLNRELKSYFTMEDQEFPQINELGNPAGTGRFYRIPEKENKTSGYIYIGRVFSCRANGCDLKLNIEDQHASEYFDYFILFNPEGSILSVRVYNYQATHGQEVTAKSWLKKFKGYNGKHDFTGKYSIDALSGATISSAGIIKDISIQTLKLKAYLER